MNKVVLMGRLTRDPEVRYSQNSPEPIAIARYTLAVRRKFKKDGETDDFIPCVAFRRDGEFAEKYLKKGMLIAVSGRIQVRSFEDQQGQKRWMTEVVIEEQDFAESKATFEGRESRDSGRGEPQQQSGYDQDGFSAISESIDDDDLPF
ncbi:MAG: single-stranded DNA-binding protein [Defluviitaleaceae bacterium]|nr:single-stranded DNA-binding protein [Defluviitaleaceae bacterium]